MWQNKCSTESLLRWVFSHFWCLFVTSVAARDSCRHSKGQMGGGRKKKNCRLKESSWIEEPSKEVILKVEERINHIGRHLISNLQWLTAVSGTARNASRYNSIGLKLGHTAIKSAKLVESSLTSSLHLPGRRKEGGKKSTGGCCFHSAGKGSAGSASFSIHKHAEAVLTCLVSVDDLYLVRIITFMPAANNDKSLSVSPQRRVLNEATSHASAVRQEEDLFRNKFQQAAGTRAKLLHLEAESITALKQ